MARRPVGRALRSHPANRLTTTQPRNPNSTMNNTTTDTLRVSVTYQTVTPESAVDGESADDGFVLENEPLDPEILAKDGIGAALEDAICLSIGYFGLRGCFEAGNLTDFYTVDASPDYSDGSSTSYAIHLGDGWTDEQIQEAHDYLTA